MEILSDWKSLTAALLDDAAVKSRSDASTSNLLFFGMGMRSNTQQSQLNQSPNIPFKSVCILSLLHSSPMLNMVSLQGGHPVRLEEPDCSSAG